MTRARRNAAFPIRMVGIALVWAAILGLSPLPTVFADSPNAAPITPATAIHGLPGNNPGFGGNSANPAGNGANGGNGIHDIAGGAPGWGGTSAAGGGQPPACTMHGGLGSVNGNCD